MSVSYVHSSGNRPTKSVIIPDQWPLEFPQKGESSPSPGGGCRDIEEGYERLGNLGEGTYGDVFKAREKDTGDIVAVKRIKTDKEKEGFPITAIREIKILSMLASSSETLNGELLRENVIRLREVVRSESAKSNRGLGSVYMVFDYMEHDMAGLMDRAKQDRKAQGMPNQPPFEVGQVKRYMKQIFKGLALLDSNQILHRDLKSANLLVNNRGEVKIADFGLARKFFRKPMAAAAAANAANGGNDGVRSSPTSSQQIAQRSQNQSHQPAAPMTNRVITLWYRPPELCLGCDQYGPEVDMWSAGCIMAELLSGQPLFPGQDETDQVGKIAQVLGEPNETTLPGCGSFKDYKVITAALRQKFRMPTESRLKERLNKMHITDAGAVRMLENLLSLNPIKRMTAAEAASDPWFMQHPKMFEAHQMPQYEPSHELAMKKRREAERGKRALAYPHASQPTAYPQKPSVLEGHRPPPPNVMPPPGQPGAGYGGSSFVPGQPGAFPRGAPPGGPSRPGMYPYRGRGRSGRGYHPARGFGSQSSSAPSWQQERR